MVVVGASFFHSIAQLMRLVTTNFAQMASFPCVSTSWLSWYQPILAIFTRAQANAMFPTYQRLIDEKLSCCIRGKTQKPLSQQQDLVAVPQNTVCSMHCCGDGHYTAILWLNQSQKDCRCFTGVEHPSNSRVDCSSN